MRGRVVLVSGGTGALGQSICLAFLGMGATVCVPYVVPEEQTRLLGRISPADASRLETALCDVTDEAAVTAHVALASAQEKDPFGGDARDVVDAAGRMKVTVPKSWQDQDLSGTIVIHVRAPLQRGGHDLLVTREEGQSDVVKDGYYPVTFEIANKALASVGIESGAVEAGGLR